MERLIEGYMKFRKDVYPHQQHRFKSLAASQKPHTLFITCADSRVVPTMFTQTEPGELFHCRIVGNMVPAHGTAAGGVISAIEYSVMVLGVRNIVVCGHSDCGAMRAFLHPDKLADLQAVRGWIDHARGAIEVTKAGYSHLAEDDFVEALVKENVISQLQHLRTHPCVASRIRSRKLQIYGWYYDIGQGTISVYDEPQGVFIPLEQTAPVPVAVNA